MAKVEFNSYGGKQEFLPCEDGKVDAFVEKSGGPVDPFGDWEKKEKDAIDMNAGEAFNKKDYTKIEAMGTDYPTKPNASNGSQIKDKDDHFAVSTYDVDPMGTDASKSKSGQTSTRK